MVKYDAVLDAYTTVAVMPAARSNFAAAVVSAKAYVIGGFDSSASALENQPVVRPPGFSLMN